MTWRRYVLLLPLPLMLWQPANTTIESWWHYGFSIGWGPFKVQLTRPAKTAFMWGGDRPGDVVAHQAILWKGQDYKPGQIARCADWVRRALSEVDVNIGVARGSLGPLMADSFHDPNLGQIITDKTTLQKGDIVMFANTYNGPGRVIHGKRITHVGIYVGDGMMVDRPTASRPVQYRPIDTFEFHSALRPNEYEVVTATAPTPEPELWRRAIGRAEGTLDANGNPTPAYYGHSDPGNHKTNLGAFSYQHEASSPEEADRKWLGELKDAAKEINQQAIAKFGKPLSEAALTVALDGYTQSPNAGGKYFIHHLPSADPTPAQLEQARIAALNSSRTELGGPSMNVMSDQKRRVNVVLETLKQAN